MRRGSCRAPAEHSPIGLICVSDIQHKQNQLLFHRCFLLTWWLQRSGCTRSHSELGRETLQRQWYFVSRRGRVGRCQVCQTQHEIIISPHPIRSKQQAASSGLLLLQNSRHKCIITRRFKRGSRKYRHGGAGWSSPVARQAHNLKVTGSNPVPATKSLTTQSQNKLLAKHKH